MDGLGTDGGILPGGAVKQFRKRGFIDFCDFVNGGIFRGICGFLTVAFFNDGSVNTMPMFYTMLGTGLAINMRDKWPGEETSTGSAAGDDPSTGSGSVEGRRGRRRLRVCWRCRIDIITICIWAGH